MAIIPSVIANHEGRDRQFDIFSFLLNDRIVFINGLIDDLNANSVVAQLLYLNAENKDKEISLYINSPGGSVTAGMAIYDTIRYIKTPVHTIGIGLAASMAALLLSAGNKRFMLPHATAMIHQPLISQGIGGKESDIGIMARNLTATRRTIASILAKHTGKTIRVIEKDIENDRYMNAKEALEYGLCDGIIETV